MIDYRLIDDSIQYYELLGYKRIESPWTVTKAVSEITKPEGAREFVLKHDDNKVLVASGEQSFLYLYLKGFLPKGKFQTVTPCFRHESFDSLHTKYFIKNELIDTENPTLDSAQRMLEQAAAFFAKYLGPIDIKKTSETSFDLEYKHIELGSYGVRECQFLRWAYGTGCAEPRLSATIKNYGKR